MKNIYKIIKKILKKCLYIINFIIYFTAALVKANASMTYAVIFRQKNQINPNFIKIDVSDITKSEIILLSHCITLTPGTTTIEVSSDLKTILIHAFDATNPDLVKTSIENELKKPILRFTRC